MGLPKKEEHEIRRKMWPSKHRSELNTQKAKKGRGVRPGNNKKQTKGRRFNYSQTRFVTGMENRNSDHFRPKRINYLRRVFGNELEHLIETNASALVIAVLGKKEVVAIWDSIPNPALKRRIKHNSSPISRH